MNNNIVFDNDNNSDQNSELLKKNTPDTIDYNSLYNTKSNINVNKNIINENTYNQNNTSPSPTNLDNQETNTAQKKKSVNSLLFVFILIWIVI